MSYPSCGLVGQPDAALVDRDDLEVPGQRRHQQAPRVPGLRPAVDQQQRRAVTADDRVQAHVTGVDVPAGERVGEPGREVRRPGDGAGAFGDGGSGSWHDISFLERSDLNAARISSREELRLLPGGEVAAPVDLVEVDEVGVGLLDPAARGPEDLAGERGEADRERDRRRSLAGRGAWPGLVRSPSTTGPPRRRCPSASTA